MSKNEKIKNFDPNGVGLNNGHFIGLPFEEEEANIIFLPIPWDVTVSYAEGTASGAENILQASGQLDLFDPYVQDAWKAGIYMRPSDETWSNKSSELREKAKQYIDWLENGSDDQFLAEMMHIKEAINQASIALNQWVKTQTTNLLEAGKLVGLVGGEHSTPLGYLEALAEKYHSFGILQIDAHMDLRKAYEGFTHSHASIFYNALSISNIEKLVQVGIRDYCEEEVAFAKSQGERVSIFYDHEIKEMQFKQVAYDQICNDVVESLPDKVYISFDIDGLRPNLCPHTGTPVPGGLDFAEAIYLIKKVVDSGRTIIGFDLSEVAGIGHEWDGNVGARILYRMANLAAKSQNLV
jgi:agmatinase